MRTKGIEKMTLTLRVYPEDAMQFLTALYRRGVLSEKQYLAKTERALALLEKNKKHYKKD